MVNVFHCHKEIIETSEILQNLNGATQVWRDFLSLIKVFKSMLQLYDFSQVIELRFWLRHHGKIFLIKY